MRVMSIHERAEYLSDAIFSASDGIVTTFAVVAGSAGATLNPNIVIVLGFANLFADGFSMAVGRYFGVKSEIEYETVKGKDARSYEGSPINHAVISFLSFDLAGIVPLLPFIFNFDSPFVSSSILVGIAFFVVGLSKSIFRKKLALRSGIEMLVIGGFAAMLAFGVGFLINKIVS